MDRAQSTNDPRIDESPTRYSFSVLRERMRQRGGTVLDFAFGRHKLVLPKPLTEFVKSQAHLALMRANDTEVETFAQQAAEMLAREYNVQVTPEAVVPAPGGRAAMSALVNVLLAPGDGVLVTEPGYPAFARLAAYRHARVHPVWLDPRHGFDPDLDELNDDDAASISLIALNYPNNPTGAVLSDRLLASYRDRVGSGARLFNDATYGLLTYDETPRSLFSFTGDGGSDFAAIELHAFAKLFPVGPLGIAFLVGPPPLIQRVRDYADFAWTPLSALQVGVAGQCAEDAAHVTATRDWFKDRIARLRVALETAGFEPYPTAAGMYVLCRVPARIGDAPTTTAQQAAGTLLDRFGIAVAPWDARRHGYLRFSSLYRDDELQAFQDMTLEIASET